MKAKSDLLRSNETYQINYASIKQLSSNG